MVGELQLAVYEENGAVSERRELYQVRRTLGAGGFGAKGIVILLLVSVQRAIYLLVPQGQTLRSSETRLQGSRTYSGRSLDYNNTRLL
jgi:hypothetical protein